MKCRFLLCAFILVAIVLALVMPAMSELNWNNYAIINDITHQPPGGVSYRVIAVDGKEELRMHGRLQSRAPLVLTGTGTPRFDIQRTDHDVKTTLHVTAYVEVGNRYRITEESGGPAIVPE